MNDIWKDGTKYKFVSLKIQYLNALELALKVKILPLSKVLDIGCGTGDLLIYLAKKHKNSSFCGVDISESMLDVAIKNAKKEKLHNINFVKGSIVDMGINDTFDVILSNAAFHWFRENADEALFRKFLKPKGRVAVHTAGNDESVNKFLDGQEKLFLEVIKRMGLANYYEHYTRFAERRLSPQELAEMFKKAGFLIVDHGLVVRKTFFSNTSEYLGWLDASGNALFELLPENKKKLVRQEFIKSILSRPDLLESYHASSFCIAMLK